MNIIGITQARLGSSRLPSKVLLQIKEKTLLEYHLRRAKQSKLVNSWILATTYEVGSEQLCDIARLCGFKAFKGDEHDVLKRFYDAVKDEKPDYVVRITSDCPLIDPTLIDMVAEYCVKNKLNYYSNIINEVYPDGLDVECFSFLALKQAQEEAIKVSDREHVTPYIKRAFKAPQIDSIPNTSYANLRLTVDEMADFNLIKHLIETLGEDASWISYADYLLKNPEIRAMNEHIVRNEGFLKSKIAEVQLRKISDFSKSNEYRSQIHNLIPGGAHTYSKGDDQFPEHAPAAIDYGRDAHVWDIDGNKYLDCSMGLTSVSLGHAYKPVLERVKKELDRGVNFQRPSVLEMEAAKAFLGLVPQHDMIKFAKNGSIVTTAAVKLARAKTGRTLVAFPGDHPFYSYDDWFIGSTACNKGIPESIQSLSVTFKSCDINSLMKLFETYPNQIACVITEPERNTCDTHCSCQGNPGHFLNQAIELAHQNGALFIVDEMITGFKTHFPGSITKYQIEPDMATWGKGIANGFSFCALTGKKEVMELGGIRNRGTEKVFLISTTHGGETHALAAALETIQIFKKESVLEHNISIGEKLIDLCRYILQKHQADSFIQILPCPWMVTFNFRDAQGEISAGFRTLMMQEMIYRGVLFQGIFIPCFTHTEVDLYYFAKAFDESLGIYLKALKEGYEKYLKGEPAKPVFRKKL